MSSFVIDVRDLRKSFGASGRTSIGCPGLSSAAISGRGRASTRYTSLARLDWL